jgi:DNA polymerase III epsilon subunit-like protein
MHSLNDDRSHADANTPLDEVCAVCRPLYEHLEAHRAAIHWARDLVNQPDWVILDMETTGLGPDAEVIELAVLDPMGRVLLDTLAQPQGRIPAEATTLHGITDADVASAPIFPTIWGRLRQVLSGRRVIIYNATYDIGVLAQTAALSAAVGRDRRRLRDAPVRGVSPGAASKR